MTAKQLSIGALERIAQGIMTELGAGYSEVIYRNALARELQARDTSTLIEHTIPVMFRGAFLGTCRADIVTSQYVIEIKALRTVLPPGVTHQIQKYLRHLAENETPSIRHGVIINFNQSTETIDFRVHCPHSLCQDAPASPLPTALSFMPEGRAHE